MSPDHLAAKEGLSSGCREDRRRQRNQDASVDPHHRILRSSNQVTSDNVWLVEVTIFESRRAKRV